MNPRVPAVLLLLQLALAPAALAGAGPVGTQVQQKPASPASDPPFWARPKPAQPPAAPDCDCAGDAAPAEEPNRLTPATGAALGAGSIVFLLLLWNWLRPKGQPAQVRVSAPAPAKAAPPPEPEVRRASALPIHESEPLDAPPGGDIELIEESAEDDAERTQQFYSDVAVSLADAIEKNPDRQDLWRKLFEVYHAANQAAEYVNLAYAFVERQDGRNSPHWHAIGSMGRQLLPEHELFTEFGESKEKAKRTLQFRRHYDRRLDQGSLFRAQEHLEAGYAEVRQRPEFQALLSRALADAAHRPSPVAPATAIDLGSDGARIFLKREDRRRSHDDVLINATGQVLLAQHLGHRQVVAATRNGTHGLATATVAARLGMQCILYIAEQDLRTHYARVLTLRKLGAQVRPVRTDPESRFDDPRQYALTDWLEKPDRCLYVCGLTGGPHPFPMVVGEIQASVGHEAYDQMERSIGRRPEAVVVHARDGYFGKGLLRGFLEHDSVKLYYVDAPDPDHPEAPGASRMFLREHRWLRDTGRVIYVDGNDNEAMRIIEQFHSGGTSLNIDTGRALAHAKQIALQCDPEDAVLVAYCTQEESSRSDSFD